MKTINMRQVAILMLVCLTIRYASSARLLKDNIAIKADSSTSALQPRTLDIGSLGSLIPIVKAMFQEIIQDLVHQALSFILEEVHIYKLNFLKKLGKYTLAEVFHYIFDGVTDFVHTESEVEAISTTEAEEKVSESETDMSFLPYEWRQRQMMQAQENRRKRM